MHISKHYISTCPTEIFTLHKQDRRWNADKPSAALDSYIPTWLTTSPAYHRPANFRFFLNIERKLRKVVQPQVQLMSIKFKFEVPILWPFQVQVITNIIYLVYNGHVKTYFHSMSLKTN